MKQTWKRVRMKTLQAKAGFTLVELIVVIAILGILAGVAVPTYSGYVKKANLAADEQLLSAVNTAFASACIANGEDINAIEEATIELSGDIGAKTIVPDSVDPHGADFEGFFKGNENAAFKVISSLIFDADKHMFVNPEVVAYLTIGYGGAKITVTAEQIQALKDSSYYGEGMTSETLLKQVDGAAAVAGAMNTIGDLQSSPEFLAFAAGALGLESAADLPAALFNMANKALDGNYATFADVPDELYDAYATKMQQIKNNAMILYTAQQTTKLDSAAASQLLAGVGTVEKFSDTIKANMKSDDVAKKQEGLSQAALAYGLYYAYVNSDACKDPNVETVNIDPLTVITALDTDPDFQEFMGSKQGQKDMAAYLEALSIVDNGAKNPGAVEKLVTTGFIDLNGVLTSTMGK